MKVALCLSGHFRSFERVYSSLKQAIIDLYQPDIFISTWQTLGFDGVRGDAHIKNTSLNTQKIEQLFSPKLSLIEPEKKWDTSKYQIREKIGLRDPQIIFGMYYGIYTVNQLKKQYEQQHNFVYDVVIRSRADLQFETILPTNEMWDAKQKVYIPKFGNYNGFNDQFAFGSSAEMDLYCSTYPNLEQFYNNGCLWHAETLMKHTATHFNIPIFRTNIKYFLMRANGYAFRLECKEKYGDIL